MTPITNDPLRALVKGEASTAHAGQSGLSITHAEVGHLKALAVLFDQYRQFYAQTSNVPAAEHFLFERMLNKESVIYLAFVNGELAGFTQLYPTFSSVNLKPLWILNDLFVSEQHRKTGVATALIQEAKTLVLDRSDYGLTLSTANENSRAQALYSKLGFKPDSTFRHLEWCPQG